MNENMDTKKDPMTNSNNPKKQTKKKELTMVMATATATATTTATATADPYQPLPDLFNDSNLPLRLRKLGGRNLEFQCNNCKKDVLPCSSCRRLVKNQPKTKTDVLKRLYPALRHKNAYFTWLLRRHNGHVGTCLEEIGDTIKVQEVDIKWSVSKAHILTSRKALYDKLVRKLAVCIPMIATDYNALRRSNPTLNEYKAIIQCLQELQLDGSYWRDKIEKLECDVLKMERDVQKFNKKRTSLIVAATKGGYKCYDSTIGYHLSDDQFCPYISPSSPSDSPSLPYVTSKGITNSNPPSSTTTATTNPPTTYTTPTTFTMKGHRMIKPTNIFHCQICSSKVPSKEGGLYHCEACLLCEACIHYNSTMISPTIPTSLSILPQSQQTKQKKGKEDEEKYEYEYEHEHEHEHDDAALLMNNQCHAVSNGGHLHHHAMKFNNNRSCNVICDICKLKDKKGVNNSRDSVWYCVTCNFDICLDCARTPAPVNYNRKEGKCITVATTNATDTDTATATATISTDGTSSDRAACDPGDGERERDGAIVPRIKPSFEILAERRAADQWERHWDNTMNNDSPLMGNGNVLTTRRDRRETIRERRYNDNIPLPILCKPNDAMLPTSATVTLHLLQNLYKEHKKIAASEVQIGEDILRHVAPTAQEDIKSYALLLACIREGAIGVAGTLLLSQAYGPKQTNSKFVGSYTQGNNNNKNNNNEEMTCFCGGVINKETAPDGCVGCLKGHAMHASCASDLLLGGGSCPTCRQILFFPKIASSEIKAGATFAKDELNRIRQEEEDNVKKQLEECAKNKVDITFHVGDVVRISDNKERCIKMQHVDPISGWWHEDMSAACGLEGTVTKVLRQDNKTTSIRVLFQGQHAFIVATKVASFKCKKCDTNFPLRNSLYSRYCKHCQVCEACCIRATHQCSTQRHEWFWNPSLLTLLRRKNDILSQDSGTSKAEEQILSLRGELISIKAAREVVKEKTMGIKFDPKCFGRGLCEESNDAISTMINSAGVSLSEWERARHFLLLAKQWDQSQESEAKRVILYGAVREGNLESAARTVRRYNAKIIAEDAKWASVLSDTSKYVVEHSAIVNLSAFPSVRSPKTGFSLDRTLHFCSEKEILDDYGNMWIRVGWARDTNISAYSNPSKPQGWLQVRPLGHGSAPVVKRADNCLRCFSCGDDLQTVGLIEDNYEAVDCSKVKQGDVLVVAATLEKVQVQSWNTSMIGCTFVMTHDDEKCNVGDKRKLKETSDLDTFIWYPPSYLLLPRLCNSKTHDLDETTLIDGCLRSRRETLLSFGGDEALARKAWKEAKSKEPEDDEVGFASCVRGHLLHARCLQKALVSGSRCPAPGCMEQLYLPSVTREPSGDDTTCCNGESNTNDEAMEAISELTEFYNHLATTTKAGEYSATEADDALVDKKLKMCPMCCSGPILNEHCSNMSSHHGQCSATVLGKIVSPPCTPTGRYRVSSSEISKRMLQVSKTKSVASLLPRCETHNTAVLFNGCMVCGYVFTNTSWNHLPDWDPKARENQDLDKKKRNAARLLTDQIKAEASLLQFERDALCEAGDHSKDNSDAGWSGKTMNTKIEPPAKLSPPARPEGVTAEDRRRATIPTFRRLHRIRRRRMHGR